MNKTLISPSILSADFGNLARDIGIINQSEADWLHVDVMDGVFVPNISFGFPVINAVKKLSKIPLDVHLMIVDPSRYISDFVKAGADILTVHYESCNHLHRLVASIKELGIKAGVALNPHTPVQALQDIITDLDIVLIMSVNPGYGGQSFINNSYKKVRELKELILKTNSTAMIEVDGGVGLNNAKMLIEAGVDILVAGNSVFKSENPQQTIYLLKNS